MWSAESYNQVYIENQFIKIIDIDKILPNYAKYVFCIRNFFFSTNHKRRDNQYENKVSLNPCSIMV